ncbi:hypothetical protein L1987_18136 [Smallanthus sonchifolius]|uniref:Uncharacterized protein n=1 Tax=Smallanthus sonchifolius TaxID=185202 RepID=A0ACB9IYQ9_9ASTR|nr:hypothetical protein L1987_18136 [Smallanthus sonchifolius]
MEKPLWENQNLRYPDAVFVVGMKIGHEIAVDRAVMLEKIIRLGNENLEGIRSSNKRKRLGFEGVLSSDLKNLKRVGGGGGCDRRR